MTAMDNGAIIERFTAYLAGERRYSPLTVRNYRRDIAAFAAWGESAGSAEAAPHGTHGAAFDLCRVRGEDVRAWVMHLSDEGRMNNASINRCVASLRSLYRYVNHLEQSRQQSGRYEIALWNKAFYPIAILVMIALAMPFAYMNRRSGGVSIKIFGGVMIGLAFYTINNLFSYIGMLNTWPPLVVAMVPTACMLVLAMIGMWFVERR